MENIFMQWIYNKRHSNKVIHYIKFRWFLHKLNKVTPNFDMLCNIADFIKMLEVVYLYTNFKPSVLYSLTKSKTDMGFILNVNGHEIVFTLTEDEDRYIRIEIYNLNGKVRSSVSFKDGATDIIETVHDEQLFINITDWLMKAVIDLLKTYYKKA